MQSPGYDVSPSDSLQTLPAAATTAKFSERRLVLEGHPLSESQLSLPYRRSNPSAASLFASTQTPPGSRPISPVGRTGSPARNLSGSVYGGPRARSLIDSATDSPGEPLNLLLRAYVPHVAIYASEDTAEFTREKGLKHGLWELLRPFGERIQGKVTIRDSSGSSRMWEDYSIRFVRLGDDVESPPPSTPNGVPENAAREKKRLDDVETVVARHLQYAEDSFAQFPHPGHLTSQGLEVEATSPYYSLYLRRLLSGIPVSPHETFSHPVACVIAISSRSKSPIEELRQLYNDTRQGDKKLPGWVDGEYLRYYVLVHDEERDDITRSLSLFDQMKRHLGLHCHLLRLRSSQSAETDDDSIPLPRSDWMTAEEELADIKRSEDEEDFEDPTRYIFESDATAIRTFVREMVTHSIIPTMERHVSLWNDQVASRRRGIAGRFMNLSRKWGGFGGGSRSSTGGDPGSGGYESQGYFAADASEAIMRKLADFAFMLRDWKLAHSTYDILRSDFADAKAWKYHAATNEMAALSLLIMPQSPHNSGGSSSRARAEALDQMLDAAFYSYHTRCSSPFGGLRALTLGIELLRLRGGSAVDDAAKWGARLLDSKIPGPIADALVKERLAVCYVSRGGGSRSRKAAIWAVLSTEAWLLQEKPIQSQRCLNEARRLYSDQHRKLLSAGLTSPPRSPVAAPAEPAPAPALAGSIQGEKSAIAGFTLANDFLRGLQAHLDEKLDGYCAAAAGATSGRDGDEDEKGRSPTHDGGAESEEIDEESEALDGGGVVGGIGPSGTANSNKRGSVMVRQGSLAAATLETAPLNDVPLVGENRGAGDAPSVQDDFERE